MSGPAILGWSLTSSTQVNPSAEFLAVKILTNPHCHGLEELRSAATYRARVVNILNNRKSEKLDADYCHQFTPSPPSSSLPSESRLTIPADLPPALFTHIAHGLAYTTGSALGSTPPTTETCLEAFQKQNKAGLTAGSRAWSKHAHRSLPPTSSLSEEDKESRRKSAGWWGTPSGPVSSINSKALVLFWKVFEGAMWRNLHWLPHRVLVYEVRVPEGYGMRWSQNQGDLKEENEEQDIVSRDSRPWLFRGFVEPSMENGHEVGWRHIA